MANTIGSVVIEMAVNLARLRSDFGQAAQISQTRLREIQREATTAVNGITKLGRTVQATFGAIGIGVGITSIVSGLKNAAAAAIQYGDEMEKAALKTGLGAGQFATLANAARLADVDVQTLSKGLRTLQTNISKAGTGDKNLVKLFADLGIEVERFQSLRADQQLEALAEQITRLKDPADRARVGTELLGKSWDQLAPFMLEGAEGIRKAREEIDRLGGALTDQQIKALADADTAVKKLRFSWDQLARTLTAEVSPALITVIDKITTLSKIDLGKTLLGFLGGPGAGVMNLAQQVGAVEAAARRQRNLEAVSRRPNATERGEGAITGAPRLTSTVKADAMSGLTEINVWQREIYNLRNEQDALLTEFERDFNESFTRSINASAVEMRKLGGELANAGERSREGFEQMSVFAEEAARNMQDAFAEFLFDPLKAGFRGMLAGFVDTIRRMVAEIAAQQLLKSFFGWAAGAATGAGYAGLGGFLSQMALTSGGTRASGGPVSAGSAYLVGERGPELFLPRQSGMIVPNGAMGAVNVNYVINAQGADAERVLAVLPPLLRRTKDETIAAVLDLQRRGRLA